MTKAFAIRSSDIAACPKRSFSPRHFRTDGSCRCDERAYVLGCLHYGGRPFVSTGGKVEAVKQSFRCEVDKDTYVVLVRHDDGDWKCSLWFEGGQIWGAGEDPTKAVVDLEGKIERLMHQLGRKED